MRRAALRGLVGQDGGRQLRWDLYEVRRTILLDALEEEDYQNVVLARARMLAGIQGKVEEQVKAFRDYTDAVFPHWQIKKEEADPNPDSAREAFVNRFKTLQQQGVIADGQ